MRLPNPEPVNNRLSPRIVWVVSLFLLLILFVSCNRPEISKEEKRAQNIGNSIMCPICPGESIDQSQNELAVQMRSIVREKIREGFTDQEVKQYFAGVEVGVLVSEQGLVPSVSFWGDGYVPFFMIVIVLEMIQGQFRRMLG